MFKNKKPEVDFDFFEKKDLNYQKKISNYNLSAEQIISDLSLNYISFLIFIIFILFPIKYLLKIEDILLPITDFFINISKFYFLLLGIVQSLRFCNKKNILNQVTHCAAHLGFFYLFFNSGLFKKIILGFFNFF